MLLKTPVTVFLLTSIFEMVPGAGIYYTTYYIIQGENALSLANGISTFKVHRGAGCRHRADAGPAHAEGA